MGQQIIRTEAQKMVDRSCVRWISCVECVGIEVTDAKERISRRRRRRESRRKKICEQRVIAGLTKVELFIDRAVVGP